MVTFRLVVLSNFLRIALAQALPAFSISLKYDIPLWFAFASISLISFDGNIFIIICFHLS